MASIIWAARAPYHVAPNPSEVVRDIEDFRSHNPSSSYMFFDRVDGHGSPVAGQVAINLDHISSVAPVVSPRP